MPVLPLLLDDVLMLLESLLTLELGRVYFQLYQPLLDGEHALFVAPKLFFLVAVLQKPLLESRRA